MPDQVSDLEAVLGAGPLLLVHAHPDDETIGTGATMALAAARGRAVTLVTCTRGEQGEVIPAGLAHLYGDGRALGAWRERELAAATAALGVADHRFLGAPGRRYADSGMSWGPDGRAVPAASPPPGAFALADLDPAAEDLLAVILEVRPGVLISYGPDGGYGHPDHVRAHQVTMRAAELLGAGAPRVFWSVPPGTADAVKVDASAARHAKVAAMRAHATQIQVSPDGSEFALSNGRSAPISGIEYYLPAR